MKTKELTYSNILPRFPFFLLFYLDMFSSIIDSERVLLSEFLINRIKTIDILE